MIRGVVLAMFSTCLLTALSLPAQSPADKTRDKAAIRDVVKKYVDARERTDAKAVEALFTRDADQLTSSGEWRKGLDEVVRGTMASSQRSTGTRSITLENIRFPAPGTAIADGRYEISGAQGAASRKMWTTLILTRGAEGWRIAAIRNMLPAAQ